MRQNKQFEKNTTWEHLIVAIFHYPQVLSFNLKLLIVPHFAKCLQTVLKTFINSHWNHIHPS